MLSSMYTFALGRKFIRAITIYRSILLWPWILSAIRLLSLRKTCRCSSFTLRTLFLHFNVPSTNYYRYISLTYRWYTFVTTHARSISRFYRDFIEMIIEILSRFYRDDGNLRERWLNEILCKKTYRVKNGYRSRMHSVFMKILYYQGCGWLRHTLL